MQSLYILSSIKRFAVKKIVSHAKFKKYETYTQTDRIISTGDSNSLNQDELNYGSNNYTTRIRSIRYRKISYKVISTTLTSNALLIVVVAFYSVKSYKKKYDKIINSCC